MRTFDEMRRVVQMAYRRRRLILVPLLLMVPVSIVFALLTPQRFQARSLALFQEIELENPLARTPVAINERMQERISGFRALIRSDAVLGPLIDEEMRSSGPAIPRAERIRFIRDSISVESVGNNLIEFRLTGSPAAGLGGRLDKLMANFLETYRQVAPQRAGARLVMIDAPRDPDRPMTGRSLIVIFGALGGLLLGLGLAVIAEAVDQTVRTTSDLKRIDNLPPVIRLAKLTNPPLIKAVSEIPRFPLLRRATIIVLPFILLAAAYAFLDAEGLKASPNQLFDRLHQTESSS
jgi:hypothetical protein